MPRESVHQKLARVRKPRVHITYDVDVGNAIEKKELPFVVGVLADLSGNPKDALAKVKERKFVEIDRDNFNQVMKACNARVVLKAANRLADDGSQLGVELRFHALDDFGPERVAEQIEPLRKLVEARRQLHELAARVSASDRLNGLLQRVLDSSNTLDALRAEMARA